MPGDQLKLDRRRASSSASTLRTARRLWRSRPAGQLPLLAGWGLALFGVSAAGCDRAERKPRLTLPPDAVVAFIGLAPEEHGAHLYDAGVATFAERASPPPQVRLFTPAASSPAALDATVSEALRIRPRAVVLATPAQGVGPAAASQLRNLTGPLVLLGPADPLLTPSARIDLDWAEAGRMLGGELRRLAPEARSFVLLHESSAGDQASGCRARFEEAVRISGGLRMLDERDCSITGGDCLDGLADLLRTFPNCGFVATLTPRPWLARGADELLADGHRFATVGAMPELWQRLRRRQALALVGGIEPAAAQAAIRMAVDLCCGEPGGVTQLLPCEIVTLVNLAEFERRYREAAGGDIDRFGAVHVGPPPP